MNRVAIYARVWIAINAILLGVRFTVLAGTTSLQRTPLAFGYLVLFFVMAAVASVYEQRRVLVRIAGHGRGTFGRLRSWSKTVFPEFNPGDDRDLLAFRRLCAWAFGAMIVVVPLLVF